jgi:hypothetical protein
MNVFFFLLILSSSPNVLRSENFSRTFVSGGCPRISYSLKMSHIEASTLSEDLQSAEQTLRTFVEDAKSRQEAIVVEEQRLMQEVENAERELAALRAAQETRLRELASLRAEAETTVTTTRENSSGGCTSQAFH